MLVFGCNDNATAGLVGKRAFLGTGARRRRKRLQISAPDVAEIFRDQAARTAEQRRQRPLSSSARLVICPLHLAHCASRNLT
jgi:hypothetical protein